MIVHRLSQKRHIITFLNVEGKTKFKREREREYQEYQETVFET